MDITLKGIRIINLTVNTDKEEPTERIEGSYGLIASNDKVLAKQAFNGYNDIKVSMSPATSKALDAFLAAYKSDINAVIGLE